MEDYHPSLFAKGQRLRTDADIQNAIWVQAWVDIYRHGELVDYGGMIEKFDDISVSINGGYFLRVNWEIVIR